MRMIEQPVFEQLLSQVESIAGIAPPVSHQNYIRRELLKLLSRWDIDAPALLDAIRIRGDVRQDFLNCVTINETYFFREQRHFDFLRSTVLPQLSGLDRRLNFWSVSCSTGEEAVSLAVVAADYAAANAPDPAISFTVHASDINANVLSQFRSGRFSLRSFRRDGSDYHDLLRTYGHSTGDATAGIFVVNPALLRNIHIFRVNVCGQDVSGQRNEQRPEMVDVVFFRNTLLYMTMDKRPAIIDSIVQQMAPGGWLFLSSSEVPFVEHNELEIVEHSGLYCFRKRQPAVVQSSVTRPPAPPPVRNMDTQVAAVLTAIHTGRLEEAESRLDTLKAGGLEACIERFLRGQLYRSRNQIAAAAAQFARSFDHTPRFWPGRFYYALCIKDCDPQVALMEFRTIVAERQQIKNNNEYTFLLDGFDPGLFEQMARDWIGQLE